MMESIEVKQSDTRLWCVSVDGEYHDEGVSVYFADKEDAEALSELLKKATSIIF